MSVSETAKARAEAAFKRKEAQAHDGANAWAEYEAKTLAIAENTKRLKALRLAKEAAKSEATKESGRTAHSGVRVRASLQEGKRRGSRPD
jgi:hypothetical protein